MSNIEGNTQHQKHKKKQVVTRTQKTITPTE